MDTLRQRVPFRQAGDDDINPEDDEQHVMDEQEQQELIETLREAARTADRIHIRSLRMVLIAAIMIQVNFLTMLLINRRRQALVPTPLGMILKFAPSPLIPIPAFFTILAIGLHVLDSLSLTKDPRVSLLDVDMPFNAPGVLEGPFRKRAMLYLIAPFMSAVLRRSFSQTFWWLMPAIIIGLVALAQKWMRETDEGVERLEELRYDARGA
ncbi:hypothetical protein M407DRAFT_246907 [Tulasnella calospora MUT 4182]|uniref:Uncharacterized protein n=1 Tax=Tulasnella calospora MUT 4182 TaxID=1051891 RepID=A0A0C3PQK6_9AGAM|nr:hypothetical protein M407DRAFT_246907 [Tulasnella calospora MUT 4182]